MWRNDSDTRIIFLNSGSWLRLRGIFFSFPVPNSDSVNQFFSDSGSWPHLLVRFCRLRLPAPIAGFHFFSIKWCGVVGKSDLWGSVKAGTPTRHKWFCALSFYILQCLPIRTQWTKQYSNSGVESVSGETSSSMLIIFFLLSEKKCCKCSVWICLYLFLTGEI